MFTSTVMSHCGTAIRSFRTSTTSAPMGKPAAADRPAIL